MTAPDRPPRSYPRALPQRFWPPELRSAWEGALRPVRFLQKGSPASNWSPRRRRQVRCDAGRFLAWLARDGDGAALPGRCRSVTADALEDYVEAEHARGLRLSSIATALGNVVGFLRCIRPGWDPSGAYALVDAVGAHARAEPRTPRALAHPRVLYEGGIEWMERALDDEGCVRDPAAWQQGLMVALLAVAPMRIANFAAIELGRHLAGGEGSPWQIRLDAGETKTRRSDLWEVPEALRPHLEHFLQDVRPRLMQGQQHDALWVGAFGQPLGPQGVRQRIVQVTTAVCGRPITPHSFRHAAATAFRAWYPDRPRDAAALLGHATLRTTETSYIKSQRQLALLVVQQAVARRRRRSSTVCALKCTTVASRDEEAS